MALVFQYGSNTLGARINSEDRLRGDAVFKGIAQTSDDYSLAFQVRSRSNQCAAANIVPQPGGKVWGVIWEIPDNLLSRGTAGARKSLDAIEGEGSNYERSQIRVRDDMGIEHEVLTYIALAPQAGITTSEEYAGFIVAGLREHAIPEEYITRVIEIIRTNNPAIGPEAFDLKDTV